MTHTFDIDFEPRTMREAPERISILDIVITPLDGFTGRIVSGVRAEIKKQARRARRSLSGHLVFERLIPADRNLVEFDVTGTGYFPPRPREIAMPQVRVKPTDSFADEDERTAILDTDTRLLRLIRRPEAVIDGEAMIVRGGVLRDGTWAAGVEVTGEADGNPEVFRTLTNERGVFAIRLRPPTPILDADAVRVPVRARVSLRFDGGHEWRSDEADGTDEESGTLADLRTHVIRDPIDIS
ncbi:MAG: hypothetical protein R3D30_12380 [Hyphomicrobiales bacterium]